jgi:tetratricopeptide (TPR) repeat protein
MKKIYPSIILHLFASRYGAAMKRTKGMLNKIWLAGLTILIGWSCPSQAMAQERFVPPQEADGSRRTEQGIAPSMAPAANNVAPQMGSEEAAGQQVFEVLVQELVNMIPRKLEADAEARKMIENVITAFQLREFNRASELLEELAKKDKNYPPADLLKAALSYAIRDAQNGFILLEKVAMEHPQYPGVYSAFARLALNENRISDSLAMFEKCARMIEDSDLDEEAKKYFEQQCLDGMIDVAMRQRRYDAARQYLERQVQSEPGDLKVLMSYAELEFHEKNLEKSLGYLETIKEEYPNARAPETIVAAWFEQQGDRENAAKWIRAAADKYPQDPQVLFEFASYLINIEDFPKASSVIGEAEKLSSETPFSRNLKARIAFCNMSYGIAEAHYRSLAEGQQNNFDPANMYVLSLIESKDEEKRKLAKDIATRTFRALPENVIALATLGYVHLKTGDLEQAKTIFGRLALSTGLSPEIDFFLAAYYNAIGEKDKAVGLLETNLKREGMFLYRKPAQQMVDEIKNGSDGLPEPR